MWRHSLRRIDMGLLPFNAAGCYGSQRIPKGSGRIGLYTRMPKDERLHLTEPNRRKYLFWKDFLSAILIIFCLNGNWILEGWHLLVSGRWTRLSTNRHRLPPLPSHFGQCWYPLDFLPNYPACKCFIISGYEVGTVLMISITYYCFFAQMPPLN